MRAILTSIAVVMVVGMVSVPFASADRIIVESTDRDMWRASKLIGIDVVSREGDELGEIEEVVVDPEGGRVGYVILSFDGFLREGDKYFAIPWRALRYDAHEEQMVLNVDRDRLEDAPGFSRGDWPDMASRRWARDIHAYYGVVPYWEDDVVVVERTEGGTHTIVERTEGGTRTVEGELLRVEGKFYVVRDKANREVSLHIDGDTDFRDEIGPGDYIRAGVSSGNHALWFDQIDEE